MSSAPKLDNRVNALTALLNEGLANTLDLKLQAKQAHWNVTGPNFIALHELFDTAATQIDGYADLLAERVRQLGGTAHGTVQAIAKQSKLPAYPADAHDEKQHVSAFTAGIAALADQLRKGIDIADDHGDTVTADIMTEATRGLDKLRWFVESHKG